MFMTMMLVQPTESPPNDPGILDLFPGAFLGLSLRRLTASYSGAKIKVRRSSDDAKLLIGLSGNELDTTSLLTFCGSNTGFIEEWYSEINGLIAYQDNPIRQPIIVNAGTLVTENGKPSINFNGSELIINHETDFNSTTYTIFLVGRATNAQATFLMKGTSGSAANISYLIDRDQNNFRNIRFFGGSASLSVTNALASAPFFIGSGRYGTTQHNSRVHNLIGTNVNNPASPNVNNGNVFLGSRFNSRNLIGTISELIYYPNDISTNIPDIFTGLNGYYGTY